MFLILWCSWDARQRAIPRFGRRTLSDCEGKVGSTSEIDLKCAIDLEHNEVHKYNFYNFIKNIFGVICLLITLFIKKKKITKKKKVESSIGALTPEITLSSCGSPLQTQYIKYKIVNIISSITFHFCYYMLMRKIWLILSLTILWETCGKKIRPNISIMSESHNTSIEPNVNKLLIMTRAALKS